MPPFAKGELSGEARLCEREVPRRGEGIGSIYYYIFIRARTRARGPAKSIPVGEGHAPPAGHVRNRHSNGRAMPRPYKGDRRAAASTHMPSRGVDPAWPPVSSPPIIFHDLYNRKFVFNSPIFSIEFFGSICYHDSCIGITMTIFCGRYGRRKYNLPARLVWPERRKAGIFRPAYTERNE